MGSGRPGFSSSAGEISTGRPRAAHPPLRSCARRGLTRAASAASPARSRRSSPAAWESVGTRSSGGASHGPVGKRARAVGVWRLGDEEAHSQKRPPAHVKRRNESAAVGTERAADASVCRECGAREKCVEHRERVL